jgi:hypothetical protein
MFGKDELEGSSTAGGSSAETAAVGGDDEGVSSALLAADGGDSALLSVLAPAPACPVAPLLAVASAALAPSPAFVMLVESALPRALPAGPLTRGGAERVGVGVATCTDGSIASATMTAAACMSTAQA